MSYEVLLNFFLWLSLEGIISPFLNRSKIFDLSIFVFSDIKVGNSDFIG